MVPAPALVLLLAYNAPHGVAFSVVDAMDHDVHVARG
jgi:hypothetical protein